MTTCLSRIVPLLCYVGLVTACDDSAPSHEGRDAGSTPEVTSDPAKEPKDAGEPADASSPWDSARPVGDSGDAHAPRQTTLSLLGPVNPAPGVPFVVVIEADNGRPVSGKIHLQVGKETESLTLYRGRGSITVTVPDSGSVGLKATLDDEYGERTLTVESRETRILSGELSGDDLKWSDEQDVVLSGAVIVPAGERLSVAAGTRILGEKRGSLTVYGDLVVSGSRAAPVQLSPLTSTGWLGVRVEGGTAQLSHVYFTGATGFGQAMGHSKSAPVFHSLQSTVEFNGGAIVDSSGKAFYSTKSVLELNDLVISRCDTGGEHKGSQVLLRSSHVLEIPDADGDYDDDDNDGIYLNDTLTVDEVAQTSRLIDVVFAVGEDDGIDHNNATVVVERAWIEGFRHEGVAASRGGRISVLNSVVKHCEQGIEAGYGKPHVIVENCTVTENDVGIRFGDSYDWGAEGHLSVSHSLVLHNETNVRNFTNSLGGPFPGGLEISCSQTNTPPIDGLGGNLAGSPKLSAMGCAAEESTCDNKPMGPARCR